jgi:hypothetical protein
VYGESLKLHSAAQQHLSAIICSPVISALRADSCPVVPRSRTPLPPGRRAAELRWSSLGAFRALRAGVGGQAHARRTDQGER